MVIPLLSRDIVATGIQIEIPKGYYGRIAPKSGLVVKKGIDVLAGVIDSGYRGEIGVVLMNLVYQVDLKKMTNQQKAFEGLFGDRDSFKIKEGDRIAQLIVEKCHKVEWQEVDSLDSSEREDGKFGSSGK